MCSHRRFFTAKHGSRIFFESGTSGKKLPWSYDEQLFKRWRDGKTGMPLVDANMRELKQTGELLTSFSKPVDVSSSLAVLLRGMLCGGIPASLRVAALSAGARSSPNRSSSPALPLLLFRFLPTLPASPCSAACNQHHVSALR